MLSAGVKPRVAASMVRKPPGCEGASWQCVWKGGAGAEEAMTKPANETLEVVGIVDLDAETGVLRTRDLIEDETRWRGDIGSPWSAICGRADRPIGRLRGAGVRGRVFARVKPEPSGPARPRVGVLRNLTDP